MNGLIALFATLLLATSAFGQNCPNAKFSDVKALASADARLNTETAYTVEFKVNCGKFVPLYAEVNGVFLASSWDITGTKYQFSWTEDMKSAQTGDIHLRVYDEEGFFNVKKALRNNEDSTKVKSLDTLTISHQASYRGPYLASEFVALIFFAGVFYVASSSRSTIQH